MVATILIRRLTGGGPTATDITGLNTRANTADAHSATDTASPIKIPTAGTKYSFWVVTRLDCTVTPSNTIDNLRWFTDGSISFGTGITCKMNTATGYTVASGTGGDTGIQLTTGNYPTLAGAPTDAFAFTSGAPKTVTGSISNPTTGQFGDRAVYQVEVGTTASAGTTPTEPFTFRYDET